MSFINPGLLGTQAFFRKEFLKPIEKHQDEDKRRRLHARVRAVIVPGLDQLVDPAAAAASR